MALILKCGDVPCCYRSNETTLAEILCATNLRFYRKKIDFFCEFFSLAFSPYFSLCHIVINCIKKIQTMYASLFREQRWHNGESTSLLLVIS